MSSIDPLLLKTQFWRQGDAIGFAAPCMVTAGESCVLVLMATSIAQPGSDPFPQLRRCAASRDGECGDSRCPQLRDGEPGRTGRHCPLDINRDDEGC